MDIATEKEKWIRKRAVLSVSVSQATIDFCTMYTLILSISRSVLIDALIHIISELLTPEEIIEKIKIYIQTKGVKHE